MIDHRENLAMALETLLSHKFRSFLTVLGIVVGISVVTVIASLLSGVKASVVSQIESMGANNVIAFHLSTTGGRPTREEMSRRPLTVDDAKAIKEQCPSVQDVSWIGTGASPSIAYKGKTLRGGGFRGISHSFAAINDIRLANGRFFSEAEDAHRSPVAIIGPDAAKALFADTDPVGKQLLIQGRPFTILGVPESSKLGSLVGSADNYVYIPYNTFHKLMPREENHLIYIEARSGLRQQAMDETESVLRRRRGVKPSAPANFSLTTADALVKQLDRFTRIIGLVAISISSVGLLVGGIGVMNIMLVSVTERTREIGVRKAIGATKSNIVLQFLFEAMTLTALGGVLGIILAIMISLIAMALLPSLPASISFSAILAGLVVSVAIGLVFGVWPARKAARLDPIEALRYE